MILRTWETFLIFSVDFGTGETKEVEGPVSTHFHRIGLERTLPHQIIVPQTTLLEQVGEGSCYG